MKHIGASNSRKVLPSLGLKDKWLSELGEGAAWQELWPMEEEIVSADVSLPALLSSSSAFHQLNPTRSHMQGRFPEQRERWGRIEAESGRAEFPSQTTSFVPQHPFLMLCLSGNLMSLLRGGWCSFSHTFPHKYKSLNIASVIPTKLHNPPYYLSAPWLSFLPFWVITNPRIWILTGSIFIRLFSID